MNELHGDIVEAIALRFAEMGGKKYADDLAMLNLHAAIMYFAASRGCEHAFNMVAEIYDEYAELAVMERDQRIAKLKHG